MKPSRRRGTEAGVGKQGPELLEACGEELALTSVRTGPPGLRGPRGSQTSGRPCPVSGALEATCSLGHRSGKVPVTGRGQEATEPQWQD